MYICNINYKQLQMKDLKKRTMKLIAEKEAIIREIKKVNEKRAYKLFKEVLELKSELTSINKFAKFK